VCWRVVVPCAYRSHFPAFLFYVPLRMKMRNKDDGARGGNRLKCTPLRVASVFAASAARDKAVVFLRCPLAFLGN
jgi:hypothetical protein